MVTFTQLSDGTWGVRLNAEDQEALARLSLRPDSASLSGFTPEKPVQFTATKKNGTTKEVRVTQVVADVLVRGQRQLTCRIAETRQVDALAPVAEPVPDSKLFSSLLAKPSKLSAESTLTRG